MGSYRLSMALAVVFGSFALWIRWFGDGDPAWAMALAAWWLALAAHEKPAPREE